MKTSTRDDISCFTFGHNFERVSKASHEITCKTCKTKVPVNHPNGFDALPFDNKEIMATLQQLFLLKNKLYKRQLSI